MKRAAIVAMATGAARVAGYHRRDGRSICTSMVPRRRSKSRAGSCSRRWRESASRPSGARAGATAPGSSARRWSRWRGIQHRNERTLGYLRVASDEHPLAIQIFGSDPAAMAGLRGWSRPRRRHRRHQLRCPVKKVTKTGAARRSSTSRPRRPDRPGGRSATALPVSVKMRRGTANGSRDCLAVGPRLVEAGAASLTLHPRSAKQMYTAPPTTRSPPNWSSRRRAGDRSGDITSRARARPCSRPPAPPRSWSAARHRAIPGRSPEIMGADEEPTREEVVAELLLFIRETVRELGEPAPPAS